MPLEELLAALETEAAEESARTDRLAREESARIVAAARIEAQAIEEEAARADEAELALITEQQLAQARAAATAALRGAREELFGAWFSELRARVAGLRSNARYRSVVRSLVLESIAALPAATLLRVDPRDEALVSEITAELGLAIEVSAQLEVLGGIEVSSSDGRTVRNTFEERLTNAEPALRILFGQIWSRAGSRRTRAATRPGAGDPSVSVASHSADFVYGNTRLRARKAALLGSAGFEALLDRDLEGLLEGLAGTAYRPDIVAASAIPTGERALQEIVRQHLARVLEEMRAFYDGPARSLVDLLLARFDLHNLLALLRGLVREQEGGARAGVRGSARQPRRRSCARDRASARADRRRRPARRLAPTRSGRAPRALAAAWPEFERTEDLRALEHALADSTCAESQRGAAMARARPQSRCAT